MNKLTEKLASSLAHFKQKSGFITESNSEMEPQKRWIKIYVHGSCLPSNPGNTACIGWVAYDQEDKKLDCGRGCHSDEGKITNNAAAYLSVCSAAKWAAANISTDVGIELLSNSRIMIDQLNGKIETKSPQLKNIRDEIYSLLTGIEFAGVHAPKNEVAYCLAKLAYVEFIENQKGGKS